MDKFKFNPIVKKDLTITTRNMKFAWELFGYLGILALMFFFISGFIRNVTGYTSNVSMYGTYVTFFPALAIAQLGMIGITVPITTASSVSGEREKGTLDTLLTTTISLKNIILGKMFSAVIRVMTFIFASIPLMAISFTVGGLSWKMLFEWFFLALVYAIFCGSIGVYCSSKCKKTLSAIILSYVIYFVVYAMLFIPVLFLGIFFGSIDFIEYGFAPQIFNPVMTFILFFASRLTSENDLNIFDIDLFNNVNFLLIVSVIAQLALSYFFVVRAANRIDPLKERTGRKG